VTPTPISPNRPLQWPASIRAIQSLISVDPAVYVVGGAVRDAYLHLPLHDIDLATPGDGRPIARQIADGFRGYYYSLDATRGIGRALIPWEDSQLVIDVAQFRGPDLLADLQLRDFTLNAMAVPLHGDLQTVIDPLDGLEDINAKRLRQCTDHSIRDDPIRGLRAVRTSINYALHIESETRKNIREYASALEESSPERLRDEIFALLGGKKPASAIRMLDRLSILPHIFPEVSALHGIEQPVPHQFDAWQHTLRTIEFLDNLLRVLENNSDDYAAANMQLGLTISSLADVRNHLRQHVKSVWPNERQHHALMILAGLLHDVGKPVSLRKDEDGRIRFIRHEEIGAEMVMERAKALRLSNSEAVHLTTVVRHHMRPHWLHTGSQPSPRSIYRFWRDTDAAGIDICLLAIADHVATAAHTLTSQAWSQYLQTVRSILLRYFQQLQAAILPPPLISGKHLQKHLGLPPGPLIGDILDRVREAQLIGEISTKEEALNWAQRYVDPRPED
jgi:poly(A) polymerase